MNLKRGDIVLWGNGKVHWEVEEPRLDHAHGCYVIKSPMSGRRATVFGHELRPWVRGA